MKALDLYSKYHKWAKENNYPRISFARFCEIKMFFESLGPPQTADETNGKETETN